MNKLILSLLLLVPILGFSQVDSSTKEEDIPPRQYDVVEVTTEPEIFVVVEQMPEFPGGQDSMNKFIFRNLRYPGEAIENETQGTVHVQFIVEENGMCTHINITKGIGNGCDEEAKRMIKMMKWEPGKLNGKPVRVMMRLPIKFKIN